MQEDGRWQVLLIDFDEDLLAKLNSLLKDQGLSITTAWGGREASDVLDCQKFDVIVLSDYLPDTGGRELWRLLRKIPYDTELAVIQSSYPTTQDIQDLLEEHSRHCVLNRTSPDQIAQTIVQCLRQRPA